MNSPPPRSVDDAARPQSSAALAAPTATPAYCKNCKAQLLGRYCVNCSQAADVHVPTTSELMHELMEGLTHSDSRLWSTLRCLWIQPGRLTQEFVAGRRMAYLPPFRLYLVLSVIFFLIASISHPTGDSMPGSKPTNNDRCEYVTFDSLAQHSGLNERIQRACRQIVSDNGASLMHVALATMSKAMFIFLPLVAFLHMLLYWRPRFRYAEHLLFFVHLHAFYFSLAIVMIAATDAAHFWPKAQGAADLLQTLLGWAAAIYTLIAVRRVFTKGWPAAIFKTIVLSLVYLAVFSVTVSGVFFYAILQM